MKRPIITAIAGAVLAAAACSPAKSGFEIASGSQVTLERKDGVKVAGRLVEVRPEHVIVEARDGHRTSVTRRDIASLKADTLTPAAAPPETPGAPVGSTGTRAAEPRPEAVKAGDPAPPARAYREVTIPKGTVLPVDLTSSVSSDRSSVEDPVRAKLRRPLVIGSVEALPAGTVVSGHVTAAERAARVKGRAFVAFRFTAIDPPGDAERVAIRTETVSRRAAATKKHDAAKIGGGAAGGAIIGGILGGGDGAAKGAAIGGAAGTGVVLATRGKEVRLGPGADVSVRIASPVTLRVAAQ